MNMNNTGKYGILGGFLVGLIIGAVLAVLYSTHPGYFAVAKTREAVLQDLLTSPVNDENVKLRMDYINETSERQFGNELKSMGQNPDLITPQFWEELHTKKKAEYDAIADQTRKTGLDVFDGATADELQRIRNFNFSSIAIKVAKNRGAARAKANDENEVFVKQIRDYALDLFKEKFPVEASKLRPGRGKGFGGNGQPRTAAAPAAPAANPTPAVEATPAPPAAH